MNSLTKALKNKVIGKVSDALSAPARFKANRAKHQADVDVKIIKEHRAMRERGFQPSKANSQGVTGDTRLEAAYQDVLNRRTK